METPGGQCCFLVEETPQLRGHTQNGSEQFTFKQSSFDFAISLTRNCVKRMDKNKGFIFKVINT